MSLDLFIRARQTLLYPLYVLGPGDKGANRHMLGSQRPCGEQTGSVFRRKERMRSSRAEEGPLLNPEDSSWSQWDSTTSEATDAPDSVVTDPPGLSPPVLPAFLLHLPPSAHLFPLGSPHSLSPFLPVVRMFLG